MNKSNIVKVLIENIKDYVEKNEKTMKDSGTNFSQVEFFGRMLLLKYFQENGFFNKVNETYTIDEIKNKIKLHEKFEQLFEILLLILQKENYIKISGNQLTSTEKIESKELSDSLKNAETFKQNLIKKYNDMRSHFNLLEICISKYNVILSGEKSPDGIMFPVYSMDLVEGIFRDNILADYFNSLIAKIIANYAEIKQKNNEKIAILEIGAGSGGTSLFVMEALKNYNNVEFYFTDISKVFTRGCEKKFKEKYPFAVFKKFDIETNAVDQGFIEGSFDAVFGSNVIHSTKNISNTLEGVKKLLNDDGIFLLNEVTAVQDFTTLTFGLLGGWWLFTDKEKRLPNSPLLEIDRWNKELKNSGLNNVNMVSTTHQDKPDSFSQSLFICSKN
jgi:polyketide synthase PksM